jgi:TRAP-type C4-dicarboxylate transport system permease small subunit
VNDTRAGARWGEPLVRLDAAWTKLEARLAAAVLVLEIASLCFWITLNGLSAEAGGGNQAGVVFRGAFLATICGLAAYRGVRHKVGAHQWGPVLGAILVGFFCGARWAVEGWGVQYFSNVLNWLQTASVFLLVGGLRSFATRLTLWLALLGASIATAQAKHINVDVVMRFLSPKMRVPAAIVGWAAAALVCFAGVWGFFDYIAITNFDAPTERPCASSETGKGTAPGMCPLTPSEEIALVAHEMRVDAFLTARQFSLDLNTFPHVVKGERYDQYFHAAEWNAWTKEADWGAYFTPEEVSALHVPEPPPDGPNPSRLPAVVSPHGEARKLLEKDLNFVFPFGLFMIGLRFVLRVLLVLSGHATVDPDSAHGEEDVQASHPAADAPAAPKGDA